MRARVKETGKIIEVEYIGNGKYVCQQGKWYDMEELDFNFDKIKVRVKATGEILNVSDCTSIYLENFENSLSIEDVEFLDTKEYSYSPDYWERLKHQYVGMAMQGLMSILPQIGGLDGRSKATEVIDISTSIAHALVEKMKEERK